MLLIQSSLEKGWSVLEDRKNLHKWEISIAILEMDICNGQPVRDDYIIFVCITLTVMISHGHGHGRMIVT